jgi:hypothetical protein
MSMGTCASAYPTMQYSNQIISIEGNGMGGTSAGYQTIDCNYENNKLN